ICMNCGFCAEFCPFDAIKMDHDYELASYDRSSAHIHDKERLSKPISYWREIAPKKAGAEEAARDFAKDKKSRKRTKKGEVSQEPDPTLAEETTRQLLYRGEYY
ncbi:MAG: hypothetical protein GY943_21190, partial [Chloroflexi bacterium]|nr:hypothetical protein [Chloroflexota bacterium]